MNLDHTGFNGNQEGGPGPANMESFRFQDFFQK